MVERGSLVKKGAVVLITGALVGGSVFFLMNNSKQKQEDAFNAMIREKDKIIDLYTTDVVTGLVLVRDLVEGEVIAEKDLELSFLPRINSPADLITDPKDVIGKVSKLPLGEKTAITRGMVYSPKELTDDLRKMEYDFIRLPVTIKKTDILEIQIVFPNGASYTVVPKTKLTALDVANNMVFLNAGAESRALLDSAFVDMVVNKAEVRAIQYVDGETQLEERTTYYPNPAISELIRNNPRLIDEVKARYKTGDASRMLLEQELRKMYPEGEYLRFRANLPDGSYVSQRGSGVGAGIIVVNPDENTSVGSVDSNIEELINNREEEIPKEVENIDYIEPVVTPEDDVSDIGNNGDIGNPEENSSDNELEAPQIGEE